MRRAETEAFILAATEPQSSPLVPEITLRLAREPRGIFAEAEAALRRWAVQPYWAFAWPGGQALARWLLDNPEEVRGRRVLDLGAGSGLVAIAAMRAGAARALAADIDEAAILAIAHNAALNRVAVEATAEDLLGGTSDAEVVLIADLVYLPELAERVAAFIARAVARGATVLIGDRTTAERPPMPLVELSHVRAPVVPALEETHIEWARVWRVAGAPARTGQP